MRAAGIKKGVMFPGNRRMGLFGVALGTVLVVLALLMITSWAHRRNDVAPHPPLHAAPAATP